MKDYAKMITGGAFRESIRLGRMSLVPKICVVFTHQNPTQRNVIFCLHFNKIWNIQRR